MWGCDSSSVLRCGLSFCQGENEKIHISSNTLSDLHFGNIQNADMFFEYETPTAGGVSIRASG